MPKEGLNFTRKNSRCNTLVKVAHYILGFFYRLCKMMSHKNCKDHLLRVMPMGIRILIMHDL